MNYLRTSIAALMATLGLAMPANGQIAEDFSNGLQTWFLLDTNYQLR